MSAVDYFDQLTVAKAHDQAKFVIDIAETVEEYNTISLQHVTDTETRVRMRARIRAAKRAEKAAATFRAACAALLDAE